MKELRFSHPGKHPGIIRALCVVIFVGLNLSIFSACDIPSPEDDLHPELRKVNRLKGLWTGENFYEKWWMESDTLMRGIGGQISNGDTVVTERLSLAVRKDTLYYIAAVEHNPAPVPFKATVLQPDSFVFSNPDHDYPQQIIYSFGREDSVYVILKALDQPDRTINMAGPHKEH